MPTHNHPFFVVASASFVALLVFHVFWSLRRSSASVARWPVRTVGAVVAASIAAAFALAWGLTRPHLSAISALRAAPRATLSRPAAGPAVYAGTAHGPAGRVDGNGLRSAATWWWVFYRRSRGRDGTVCFEESYRDMTLRDADGRTAPLRAFDRRLELSLLHDSNTPEWDGPLYIDLGERLAIRSEAMPPFAARCAGERHYFKGESITDNGEVEVYACYRDGALDRCDGPGPGAVLAVRNLSSHISRRQAFALDHFLAAGCFGLCVILAMLRVVSDGLTESRERLTPPEKSL